VSAALTWLDLARGVREGAYMFWETLWALVLGLSLSGVVQAFVTRDQMRARLGDHRPATVARAAGYGVVSSSCSYAATAMSKSLFAKGADFIAATVFMIASTNLVIELGAVMVVLLGWRFALGEFVGGPIMIVLLVLLGGVAFTPRFVAAARRRVEATAPAAPGTGDAAPSWREASGWSDAARYALADARMMRNELVIGYLVSGLLAQLVPTSWWGTLFLHGHGFGAAVENALVGPIIAVISWVCSIGNVPLAAALWSGGISFGGVIAFIFADLISMPLLLVYRRFYGGRVAWRMFLVLYAVMSLAGLATEGIFALFHAVPAHRTVAAVSTAPSWNYTSVLNVVALAAAAGLWWLSRRRAPEAAGLAIDPVCGMQVRIADAPARAEVGAVTYYFCADRCRDRFVENPGRFAAGPVEPMGDGAPGERAQDPVCGMEVVVAEAPARAEVGAVTYYFCADRCRDRFVEDPARYAAGPVEPRGASAPVTLVLGRKPTALAVDPVCGMSVDPTSAAASRVRDGVEYFFCCEGCAVRFDETAS
jgi:YHS domain-containing protein/uncharacterized membrane protein YraQ (UPF0718 family)